MSEVSSSKAEDDSSSTPQSDITREAAEIIKSLCSENHIWDRWFNYPHHKRAVKSDADSKHDESGITLSPIRQFLAKFSRLQVCVPGFFIAWLLLCVSHIFTNIWSSQGEPVGLVILSYIMLSIALISLMMSIFSEQLWASPAINAIQIMSISIVWATLIARLVSIQEISLFFKIVVMRVIMITPTVCLEHFFGTTISIVTGDIGIGLFLAFQKDNATDKVNRSVAQELACLGLYVLAIIVHVFYGYLSYIFKKHFRVTIERLCEDYLIQINMIKYLKGIPNYMLKLDRFGTPERSEREEPVSSSSRRLSQTRMRILTSATNQGITSNQSIKTLNNPRSFKESKDYKEPAKFGMKVSVSPTSNTSIEAFGEILKQLHFASLSKLTIKPILSDQQFSKQEFEAEIEKINTLVKYCLDKYGTYCIDEVWEDLSNYVLNRYDCFVKIEHLLSKAIFELRSEMRTLMIYSVNKKVEGYRSLYIKVRKEPSEYYGTKSITFRALKDKTKDITTGQLLPKATITDGESLYCSKFPDVPSSIVEEDDGSGLIARSAAGWPKPKEESSDVNPIIAKSHEEATKKGVAFDMGSGIHSSNFSKIVHFVEDPESRIQQANQMYPSKISQIDLKIDNIQDPHPTIPSPVTPNKSNYADFKMIRSDQEGQASMEELISTVVHDMRSPLMCIQGNLELISFELKDNPDFKQVEPLIKASIAASTLLECLVSDVLDSARISKGIFKIVADRFNLEEAICECLETLKIAAASKENSLECDYGESCKIILSDKQRLKQVLLNFLSNSIKFTNQGKIVVRVAELADTIKITIEDNGNGINKEAIPKLFEKFTSDRNARSNNKGIGLGLFICKSIIETLGPKKEIEVTSEPNVSTKITFEIYKNIKKSIAVSSASLRSVLDGNRSRVKSDVISDLTPRSVKPDLRRKSVDIFDINNQGIFESKSIIEVKKRNNNRLRLPMDLSRLSPLSSIVCNNNMGDESRMLQDEESVLRNYAPSNIENHPRKQLLPNEVSTSLKPIQMVEEEANERDEESGMDEANCKKAISRFRPVYILILDDEPAVTELLSLFTLQLGKMEQIKMEVIEAHCIMQAEHLIESHRFDIIITDYNLPDGLGPDFVSSLLQRLKTASQPLPNCILITGEDKNALDLPTLIKYYKEILKKPIPMATWNKTLKKYLQDFILPRVVIT